MISSVVADMDDMAMAYPSQDMYDRMVDRVYDEAGRMYPEEFEALNFPEASANEQFMSPFRRRRLFRDLLGVLVLSELFERRRFHHRF
jgi:hypothetical protein